MPRMARLRGEDAKEYHFCPGQHWLPGRQTAPTTKTRRAQHSDRSHLASRSGECWPKAAQPCRSWQGSECLEGLGADKSAATGSALPKRCIISAMGFDAPLIIFSSWSKEMSATGASPVRVISSAACSPAWLPEQPLSALSTPHEPPPVFRVKLQSHAI